jgi:hypothetical protein
MRNQVQLIKSANKMPYYYYTENQYFIKFKEKKRAISIHYLFTCRTDLFFLVSDEDELDDEMMIMQ